MEPANEGGQSSAGGAVAATLVVAVAVLVLVFGSGITKPLSHAHVSTPAVVARAAQSPPPSQG
jgi:hypothetical protein